MKKKYLLILALIVLGCKESTKSICPGEIIPKNWVVINQSPCDNMCDENINSDGDCQLRIIENLIDSPKGEKKLICPGPIPNGWVVIGKERCNSRCGDRPGQICEMLLIEKIN